MGGTNGASGVTKGADRGDLIAGGVIILVVALAVAAINTATHWVERPETPMWEPMVWEVSSLIGLAASLWVAWFAAARAPVDELLAAHWWPKLHFVAVHSLGVVAYSALHVAVFVAVREVAYGVMGQNYSFGGKVLYEFRKDLLSYMLHLSVFWAVTHVRRNRKDEVRPVSFDIRDGARIIRVPLDEILAVTAAGNYVEFVLEDGRRPLMRATLAAVEARLEPVGFVRTHRSWLINPARMTGMEPVGSGDWVVRLGPAEVPLSRRYPQALAQLKI